MPEKLYTANNMGGGLQVVNTPNPVNPQDLATKNYVDTYRNQFGLYVPLWEVDFGQQCGTANYTNGTIHMTAGPSDQSITKRYADTALRITAHVSYYINVSSAFTRLQCGINGGAIYDLCGLYGGATGEHTAYPVGFMYYWPPSYPQINTTGPMTVAFYLYVSSAATTVSTDANDSAHWTIAEVKF